jgi:hypothetical protein
MVHETHTVLLTTEVLGVMLKPFKEIKHPLSKKTRGKLAETREHEQAICRDTERSEKTHMQGYL